MITREAAIGCLYEIMNSAIISKEVEQNLQEIVNCIEYERYAGLHLWGADDEEVTTLATSMRTDAPEFSDHVRRQKEIADRYRFIPSQAEMEDFTEDEEGDAEKN